MAKEKKERAKKYESKLAINGSFTEVIKIALTKPKSKAPAKKSTR